MNLIDLVAVLALFQLVVFSFFVGAARGKYGVKAPAVTGNEMFERAYRVQMNTLELMVVFVPALYIAGKYWPSAWVAGLGAVYLVGRLIYRQSYLKDPASRSAGFGLSFFPIVVLLVLALIGAVRGA